MKLEKICGIVVIKMRQFNFDPLQRNIYPLKPPMIGDIIYNGIDRLRWFDIEEDLYNKKLPEEIVTLYEHLRRTDSTGLPLSQDIIVTQKLLKYSNKMAETNELVAVTGGLLSYYSKYMPEIEFRHHEFLGYEPWPIGCWSLIEAGIFQENSPLIRWASSLNKNGLFDNPKIAEDFMQSYLRASNEGLVEKVAEEIEIDILKLWRVELTGEQTGLKFMSE